MNDMESQTNKNITADSVFNLPNKKLYVCIIQILINSRLLVSIYPLRKALY
jgi:hypothetical protein